ncbi:MAG TPA: hypothetical protein VH062_16345 [Polyangiaceae bacterium]|jgi:hypothetical protein|nr:hypothetical protein [Polyangiaceae bacterium]
MTKRATLRVIALVCIGGAGLASACRSSGSPLGGPYGGNGSHLGPTDGGFPIVDATYTVPTPPVMPGAISGAPGTWTHIFTAYLQTGAVGNCTYCHPQMADPAKSYKWLDGEGYMDGKGSPLVTSDSCLSWYGGDMPPGTPPAAADAKAEMDTWAAAGAHND